MAARHQRMHSADDRLRRARPVDEVDRSMVVLDFSGIAVASRRRCSVPLPQDRFSAAHHLFPVHIADYQKVGMFRAVAAGKLLHQVVPRDGLHRGIRA